MLHAVMVGIDEYKDAAISGLSYARADARAMADLIEKRVEPSERSVRCLLDGAATRDAIMAAVGDDLHRSVRPGDIVMLYFACHGSPERRGAKDRTSLYLIPHDTDYGRIYSSAISMELEIPRWFERLAEASLVVLFVDACFSGAVGGRTFAGPVFMERPSAPGFLHDPKPISLMNLKLGRGHVILCAADDQQIAREDPGLGHGVFTHFVLEQLQCASPVGGQTIGVLELYERVAQLVSDRTDGLQQPVINTRGGRLPKLPRFG